MNALNRNIAPKLSTIPRVDIPQFQSQELEISGNLIRDNEIEVLNKTKYLKIENKLNL